MLDINDLEKRWVQYKIKSYIPHAVIVTSLLVIITIIFIIIPTEDLKVEPTSQKNTIVTPISQTATIKIKNTTTQENQPVEIETIRQVQTPTIITTTTPKIQTKHTMQLQPSLGFMNKMQNSTQPYYNNSQQNSPSIITQTTDTYKTKKNPVQEEVIEQEVEEVKDTVVQEAKKINIKRRDTKDDIAEIIKRFKKNNNPALSLFVAKKYYELGNYHQSYNYALITNNINSDIDQSWIIFAKSLVKLNKRKMAIKTLRSYIENSHSNNAQILLEEITSGEFQ